jgi:predicted DNA binding CopG/RHH family protein
MTQKTSGPSLIHANFFFIDIVGLSDPTMSTKHQIKKIETLNKSIMDCSAFSSTPRDAMMVLPTGDGMAIGFLMGPEIPLNLAIELHEKLNNYNKGKIPLEVIRVRIGIHSGNIFVVKDVLNNSNIWGPGIVIARRVMDIGDDGHILLSPRVAEDLREISDDYKRIIKPVHDYIIKHGQRLLIYSAYGKGFGNPRAPPRSSYQKSKMSQELSVRRKTTLYPNIEVNMTIKDSAAMDTHYKRTYEVQNISDKPIHEVLHGIAIDLEKTFEELNVRVYDEDGQTLKISSINLDKPYQKEFTTIFNKPILKGEKGRRFTLEYDVEEVERYFENYFGVDCRRFTLTVDYPSNMDDPVVYEVHLENEQLKRSRIQPTIQQRGLGDCRKFARWVRRDIGQGQSFRFQWNST